MTDDVTHLRALLADEHAKRCAAELDHAGAVAERDAALAACAEMRAALERSTNAHQAALYDEDLDRDDERDAQRVIDDTHALLSRPDLGAGKVLVERERLTAWRDLLTELAPTCRCDEAWTSRGRHEVNALCHMADEAKAAIADLDALLNKKVGG